KLEGRTFAPQLVFDAERRLVEGECSCDHYVRHRLHRGPCEHMLALRAAHRRGISDTIAFEHVTGRGARAAAGGKPSDREAFQAAFRAAVRRANELRAAGRTAESLRELERVARLAPPESDEHGRLQEVIAESQLDAGQHVAARDAADRALVRFPTSALALRVKRDALVQLDELAQAIQVGRSLASAENTAERWSELVRLCHQIEDWAAMHAFASEGLRHHPGAPRLIAALDAAAPHVPGAPVKAAAEALPEAPRSSWWRRAVDKLTGKTGKAKAAATATLEGKLAAIADELDRRCSVTDRRTLLHVMRVAYREDAPLDVRIEALIHALRGSNAISELPSEAGLVALLRQVLG
ncbi:MAG: hypothetical protein ACTHU0_03520, partial [Kofleriaceae bacterium]